MDATFSPHSYRAELAIIAHMMLWEDELLPEISRTVQPTDFYSPTYRALYEAAVTLWRKSAPVNPVTLYHELVAAKKWDPVMDAEMGRGIECVCNPATAIYCARWVKELAERRRAIAEGTKKVQEAVEGKGRSRRVDTPAFDME